MLCGLVFGFWGCVGFWWWWRVCVLCVCWACVSAWWQVCLVVWLVGKEPEGTAESVCCMVMALRCSSCKSGS